MLCLKTCGSFSVSVAPSTIRQWRADRPLRKFALALFLINIGSFQVINLSGKLEIFLSKWRQFWSGMFLQLFIYFLRTFCIWCERPRFTEGIKSDFSDRFRFRVRKRAQRWSWQVGTVCGWSPGVELSPRVEGSWRRLGNLAKEAVRWTWQETPVNCATEPEAGANLVKMCTKKQWN